MTHGPAWLTTLLAARSLASLALGSFLVLFAPPAGATPSAPAESTHVLIVANNHSLDRDARALRFADDDGARYYEIFRRSGARVTLLAVLDPDTARTYPGAARAARVPWARTLEKETRAIGAAVDRDNQAGRLTRFVFVYVGHGNVDASGEGYLSLQDRRLGRRELFEQLVDRVPARLVHLIIDACKSYFLLARGPETWKDDRAGRDYGEEVRAFLAQSALERYPQVGAILSTSGDEEVHEWSALRSGVFSHQLRSALTGAADINGDGHVEYSEVGAFLASANLRVTHERARLRPFVRPPPADRSASLMDLASGDPVLLQLRASAKGRFSIEDERGVRLADWHKAPGRPMRLALAPGRRYFIRHGQDESLLGPDRRGVVALSSLDRGPARAEPRGALDEAYRAELFAVPFSQSFYEGFLATSDLPGVRFTARPDDSDPGPDRPGPLAFSLEAAYGLSPMVLDGYDGLQHAVGLELRKGVHPLVFLALRAELGVSETRTNDLHSTLLRTAVLVGAGLRVPFRPWLDLTLQADIGYQALILTEERQDQPDAAQTSTDPAGLKLGSSLGLDLRPFATLPGLGLRLKGGLFGHLARVQDRTMVYALPETTLGLTYMF